MCRVYPERISRREPRNEDITIILFIVHSHYVNKKRLTQTILLSEKYAYRREYCHEQCRFRQRIKLHNYVFNS